MSKELAPAFQFYASDYLSDENVALMTPEEEGCYIRLMAYCWKEGSIPADEKKLTTLCKGVCPTKLVIDCFDFPSQNGSRLFHPRLESEREKQKKWRSKSAKGGKNSASKRKHKKDLHAEQGGSTNGQAARLKGGGTLQSSSSSSTASSNEPPKSPKGDRDNGHKNTAKFFDLFWKSYPRKEAKQPAYKSFWKINPDEALLRIMIEWLELARDSEQWQDVNKIPHPSTWLNQKRWEGNPPPRPKQPERMSSLLDDDDNEQ